MSCPEVSSDGAKPCHPALYFAQIPKFFKLKIQEVSLD
jgi:hypothetical protein